MMKAIIPCLALVVSFSLAQSQGLTEFYLGKIPPLPKDSCNITRQAADDFQQRVSDLIREIDQKIEDLKAAETAKGPANEEAAKERAMQQMSQQYGLTEEQMKQMRSGNMSAAEKKALADQVMQQQTNMSMGEVENLSTMSESGKKAYAEALGTEMMAAQQADPNKPAADNSGSNPYQLVQEQQAVQNRIYATSQRIGSAYTEVESDGDLPRMEANISSWRNQYSAMAGVDYGQGKQMDSLAGLIRGTQIRICDRYTPKYRAAVRNHFSLMKSSLPDHEELGAITARITKMQTGVDIPPESLEIGKLESIKGYLGKLEDAFQYKMYYPEEDVW